MDDIWREHEVQRDFDMRWSRIIFTMTGVIFGFILGAIAGFVIFKILFCPC